MFYKDGFFNDDINSYDPILSKFIDQELIRQQNQIELIASENIVSKSVLQAQGSVLTNKYAEGLPGKRYYGGCEFVDEVEKLAIDRAKKLFNANFVNVQPHSGAQANQAVFLSILKPGDTILGMSLDAGGHLTHGAKPNISGKWFNAIQYGVRKQDSRINFEEIEKLSVEHKPKLIIAGGSAYSRIIDFNRFREIADKINAFLLVDMAHFSGLVAGGVHPNPIDFADIVTTTTHKTLRSGRGGMILTNNEELFKKLNSAVFPGLQGGPLMHVIAGKAAGFGEALTEEFRTYTKNIVLNAQSLANSLISRGYNIVSGGTDNHIVLLSLKDKNITGFNAEIALEKAGLTCNKNGIPFDPLPPTITSGIRFGTAAATTRGFKVREFELIGNLIADVLDGFRDNSSSEKLEKLTYNKVKDLCKKFPIY